MSPSLPHLQRPICEPVELQPGARLRVDRVRHDADAVDTDPFPHFHDVHELVLFGQVSGHCIADGHRFPLAPGSAVFVPSMRQHDFALAGGARDWVLVQVDASTTQTLMQAPGLARLTRAFCAMPDPGARARLATIADWLLDGRADPAQAAPMVELLLRIVADADDVAGTPDGHDADGIERLRPAIESLRRDPGHAPSADAAAALCALSPAYFSRRFKQQVGLAWSDYVRTHRLQLAIQRLLESDRPVAEIAISLGFSTPSHFGDLFQRRFGMTPNRYRRRARN